MSECGCRVLWDSTGAAKYVVDNCQIERCPLHEAAERMLRALEHAEAAFRSAMKDNRPASDWWNDAAWLRLKVKDAIAAAKGGEG